ncbi:MAG: polysaccharide biosynthesis/export family protein [Nitrospiraceae bacterium]
MVAVIMLGSVISQPVTMFAGQSAPPSQNQTQPTEQPKAAPAPTVPGAVVPPPGYVIGPEDVLSVLFWREKDLSADVIVRPDGMISLPLINDIQAAGLTTDQLREKVMAEANKFVEDPNATVVVKQINSRKVFITGQVSKPGSYSLIGPMNVLQLIAMAGGLLEFADRSRISIMRTDEKGNPVAYSFNYSWVIDRKNLRQNIELKPGDTVLVP